ncbi:MAG: hypothetical protein KDA98_09020 [Acidimicrobiales bacterium]|nr:hypothetical protein [Acidimicrobiales bacterium]
MALNVGRWIRYAQAKVSDVVRSTEQDLARREAAREVEQADKPWLGDDAEAPSLETTRARIAWEAERAERARRAASSAESAPPGDEPAGEPTEPATGASGGGVGDADADGTAASGADGDAGSPGAGDPGTGATASDEGSTVDLERFGTGAAEAAQARIELDQRAAESAARLEAIRRELGVDDAPEGDAP